MCGQYKDDKHPSRDNEKQKLDHNHSLSNLCRIAIKHIVVNQFFLS